MTHYPDYSSISGRGGSTLRYGGRSISGRGRSTASIRQKSVSSKLVSNNSPELGMPPCIHPNIQAPEVSPSITQSPQTSQPPLTPHAEASTHVSEGQHEATEDQSNESNSTGPPWFITPDSVVIDYEVKKAIHDLVQGHYKEPWTGWGKVPRDVRQRMFTAFRGIYTWESHHESIILCHFNHEASEWLKKHLYLARTLYKGST
ncbi:uncharacterized protein LOC120282348 [Dioscorea cayenensis subsp. rotundata]|uniref:Uncharacterized protein LOC120282348 n=1 Tax=Dioscorea cayennensis subsp. rotundata TaxID=55577 RepID=A0AB40CYK1_DIOCR|nr:uncharacterized protein LOC120282348 [Dioscorea cayenensis subsp. rotundata]